MNFFKSVFSADPEPSDPPRDSQNEEDDQEQEQEEEEAAENPSSNPSSSSLGGGSGGGGGWGNLGGLLKTITSRSESVIQTYRRDLEEFGMGLKKETSVFKEVATRAVRAVPGSLEVGASVAQESLESVGQAIDEFGGSVWRGTAVIISQGKEALLSMDSDSNSPDPHSSEANPQSFNSSSKRYSRFEVQVLAIQNDANTFVEEPEDGEDFEKWRSEFKLEENDEEIEGLLYENGTLEVFFDKFVPDAVDRETFWSRYFYWVYKLKQAEEARAKLVKRVISGEEEEELSWEVDDDDVNGEETNTEVKEVEKEKKEGEKAAENDIVGTSTSNEEKKTIEEEANVEEAAKEEIVETSENPEEEAAKIEVVVSLKYLEGEKPVEASQVENVVEKVKSGGDDDSALKTEDKTPPKPKPEPRESGKDNDFTVVLSQPLMPAEDDLGWDEIDDLGEHEDKKVGGSGGSPKKVDLRKRMSVAEDDEDLSWDIEDDDDEPAKP